MSFDGNLGHFLAPQMPTTPAPIVDMDSAPQPKVQTALKPGAAPSKTPANVHGNLVGDIRSMVYLPKKVYFDRTLVYKTATPSDMRKRLDACFAMNGQKWKTRDYHASPSIKAVEASIDKVCVVVGLAPFFSFCSYSFAIFWK